MNLNRNNAKLKRVRERNLIPGFALDLTVNDPDDNMPEAPQWKFNGTDSFPAVTIQLPIFNELYVIKRL